MEAQNNVRQTLQGHSLVPVVTFNEGDDANAFMRYLLDQEVRCIEITLRTSEGINAIASLKKEFGNEVLVGAGTVTNQQQVEALQKIDADFMVSPGLTPNLQKVMQESGIPYLPGVATPSEIVSAMEMGLDTLKFFPANLFGGLNALKAYGQVFPEVIFCPTGGATKQTSEDYLALSNVFAVGGTWFQKEYQ
jgi:2-dehydro-3-deoxyphosphogluconate aldolase/(4S)-4-hydroxy-2-oxoglutarate aldolase